MSPGNPPPMVTLPEWLSGEPVRWIALPGPLDVPAVPAIDYCAVGAQETSEMLLTVQELIQARSKANTSATPQPVIIVVDEGEELLRQACRSHADPEAFIRELAATGRAVGVHLRRGNTAELLHHGSVGTEAADHLVEQDDEESGQ